MRRANIDQAFNWDDMGVHFFTHIQSEASILSSRIATAVDKGGKSSIQIDFQEYFRDYSLDVLSRVSTGRSLGYIR